MRQQDLQRLVGIGLTAISAVGFGTLAIFGRYAYADGLDTSTLLFLRFSMATLMMAGLLKWRGEALPKGATLAKLVGMGAIGYVGQSFCFLSAIKYASAGLVALLLYLYPAFVAALSAVFLKTRLTALKMGVLGLATLGAALTANPQGGEWRGVALAITAAVIYAVYIVVGAGVMQEVSAVQSSTVIFASAGIVYGGLTLIQGAHWPASANGWWTVGGMAVLATVVPVATFLAGLKRIGATEVSMVSTLEPVVTVLLAGWLFGEVLEARALVGGGMILVAVLILARGEMKGGQEKV